MDTLKVLSMAAAVVALFYDCDAQGCSKKQFGKDLVKGVKRLIGKYPSNPQFPKDWPGNRRWRTICPVKKHLVKGNMTDMQRFLLGTRSLYRYVDLLKNIYLKEASLYGRCSLTNKTKASLDKVKEGLLIAPNVYTRVDSNDHNIRLTANNVKRLSAWHALKQIQQFGKCVRSEPELENCRCAKMLFFGCYNRRRKNRKRSGSVRGTIPAITSRRG